MDSRLYKAITTGDIDGFRRLIANDENVLLQRTQVLNNTTLHVAVQFDKEVCVREILNRDSSLSLQKNLNGDTPLHIAARLGSFDIVEFLIHCARKDHEEGDVEKSSTTLLQKMVRTTNNELDTSLHEAVRFHQFGVTKLLTEADPEFKYLANNAGETPLYLAAEKGLYYFVNQILSTCRSSAYDDRYGWMAMRAAIISGNSDIMELLLVHQPNFRFEVDDNGVSVLHYAAYLVKPKVVVLLLKADPDIGYALDNKGKTALHYIAASSGKRSSGAGIAPTGVRHDAFRYELEKYIGRTITNILLRHFEFLYGRYWCWLRRHSGPIAEIIKAVSQHCPECWKLLDNNGQNLLHVAAENGQLDVIKFIMLESTMGANLINEKDKNGNTPLHLVLKSRCNECLRIISTDIRVNKKASNKDNLTALDTVLQQLDKALTDASHRDFLLAAYRFLHDDNSIWNHIQIEESYNKSLLTKEHEGGFEVACIKQLPAAWNTEESKEIDNLTQTHLVVATLVATVAFAAGIAVPGGYNSDGPHKGLPILMKSPSFKAFLVSNSTAMLLSTSAIFVHFSQRFYKGYEERIRTLRHTASRIHRLIMYAILAMLVAFITGTYSVLTLSWPFAISLCATNCVIFLAVYYRLLLLNP